ncbi:histidine kinase, partial [Oceanobacillus massiliensis]
MIIVIRHVFTAIVFSLLFAVLAIGTTFLFFPPADWSDVWTQEFANVSFVVWVFGIAISIGTITGLTLGWYWKQRFHQLEKKLDQIVKGQKVTTSDEPYRELAGIHLRIDQLQEKLRRQAEHAQRLSTERAHEREKSLQEIVVQERNRLARELHDSVSQQLFAASMMMSAINENNPPEDAVFRKQLSMVEKMIHQSQ